MELVRRGKVYNTWLEIKRRCYNTKCKGYMDYGGRGILFEDYKNDYPAFFAEVGEPPSNKYSIERKDNSLGYIPGNMEWALMSKQAKNRRKFKNNTSGATGVSVRMVKGEQYILAQWNDLNSKQCSKSFRVEKYGFDEAFRLAKEYREFMISELIKEGAEYAKDHGK